MEKIIIRPDKYRNFGDIEEQCSFYLFTDIVDTFLIEQDGSYKICEILSYGGGELATLLQQTQEPAHILVICPGHFIESVKPQQMGRRKLAVMVSNSTPTSQEAIKHFIGVIEATDSQSQKMFADHFFDILERANSLQIINEQYSTSAHFSHLNETYEWFEQAGPLPWGGQQIVPSGEISVLPMGHGQYSGDRNLAINGEISLKGFTILHSGKASFLLKDQARIYNEIGVLEEYALIATVADGIITKLYATHPSVESAKSMLEKLFAVDSRYSRIWEIGFGINTELKILPGNNAMNEVYGGAYGAIHWGLALHPYTQYHIDFICPDTKILSDTGEILIGSQNKIFSGKNQEKVVRHSATACPCIGQ